MYIYKITDLTNGKLYIGKTTQAIQTRWEEHLDHALEKGHKKPLYAAMIAHGLDNFKIEQLDIAQSEAELAQKERHWVITVGSIHPAGYNLMLPTGELESGQHHQNTKDKISESLRSNPIVTEHLSKNRWMLGRSKPVSAEHKAKISASMTGVAQTWKYKKIRCLETGIEYQSVNAAALATQIARTTISHSLRYGVPTRKKEGVSFEYVLPPKKIRKNTKNIKSLPPVDLSKPRPTVYVLAGQYGVGKTWVADQLRDKFCILSNDKEGPIESVLKMLEDPSKTYLYETPVLTTTFLNENKLRLNIKFMVMIESEEVVTERLIKRGGTGLAKVSRRFKRFASLANRYNPIFTGTSQECLDFLKKV